MFHASISVGMVGSVHVSNERFQLLISAPKKVKQEDVVENEVGHGARIIGIGSGKLIT